MSIDGGLRPLFRRYLPQFHMQSVETGGTGLGVPDTNYCCNGAEGWIEYKATDGWEVSLRPEQIGWLTARARHGGRVWIAVRRRHDGGPRRGPPVDELWLFPGALAVAAKLNGLRGPLVTRASYRWSGGPRAWRWDRVAGYLTS